MNNDTKKKYNNEKEKKYNSNTIINFTSLAHTPTINQSVKGVLQYISICIIQHYSSQVSPRKYRRILCKYIKGNKFFI